VVLVRFYNIPLRKIKFSIERSTIREATCRLRRLLLENEARVCFATVFFFFTAVEWNGVSRAPRRPTGKALCRSLAAASALDGPHHRCRDQSAAHPLVLQPRVPPYRPAPIGPGARDRRFYTTCVAKIKDL
jgi:hypothetical protein